MEENKDYQSSMEYSYGGGNATVQAPVKENVFLGAVGALAGTLIGVICIVITGQLGYVSALCGVVMGVCALRGYQMLGKTLKDPHGVEAGGEMKGIGLLDTDTVFTEKKTRTRVTGRFKKVGGILQNLSDMEMEGYEIHMGSTTLGEQTAAFTEITSFAGEEKGAAKADGVCHGNVYGTYVHGIFEKEEVVKAIVTAIGEAKGLDMTQIAGVDFAKFKEIQYNILADALRKHMDISRIYEIMEEGTDDED